VTYSILAHDPSTGELGSAVASCSIAVGGTVTYSRFGVGIVNTQHFAHLTTGQHVLDAMEEGLAPQAALDRAMAAAPSSEDRQVLAIGVDDRKGVWTGAACRPAKGHLIGESCIVAGNLLASEEVLTRMAAAFEATRGELLGQRLLASLEAGQAAGGDRRGRQSAAVRVLPPRSVEVGINVDLRVDDHADPVGELRRLLTAFLREFPRAR